MYVCIYNFLELLIVRKAACSFVAVGGLVVYMNEL